MENRVTILSPLSEGKEYWGPYFAVKKLLDRSTNVYYTVVSDSAAVSGANSIWKKILLIFRFFWLIRTTGNKNVLVLSHYWYSLYPGVLAWLCGYRVVVRLTTEMPASNPRKFILTILLRLVSRVWVLHPLMLNDYWIANKKVACIPNCVSNVPKTVEATGSIKTIGYFGAITPRKGLIEMVSYWNRINKNKSSISFVIRGVIRCQSTHIQLTSLSEKIDSFDYDPLLEPVNKANGFTGIDIFLFNSEREGFPNVVIEALGLGVPVYSSPLDATKEIFKEHPQYLVGNWEETFNHILRVNQSDFHRMRQESIRIATNYDCDKAVIKFNKLLNE